MHCDFTAAEGDIMFSKDMKRCNHLLSEIDSVYHDMSKALGFSDSEMQVLYTVYGNGGSVPLREITACSGVSKQTLNSALRKLEKQGTVELIASDGKCKTVCLTAEGAVLCDGTVSRMIDAENDVLSSWDPKDVEMYVSLMQRFLDDMKIKAKEICENDA